MSDDQIKDILKNSKTIAIVGISSEKKGEDPKNLKRKPANVVMKYMQDFGYKVIPINPFAEGENNKRRNSSWQFRKNSEKIDIVDIFRPSKETPGIANEAVKLGAKYYGCNMEFKMKKLKKLLKMPKLNMYQTNA